MKRTHLLPLLLVLALVAVLGAPTASADDDAPKGRVAAVQKALSLTKVTLEQAVETAAKKAEGTAVVTDFEVENGAPVFEVVVYVGGDSPHLVEVEVDAVTGKVIETEILGQDDDDDEEDDDDGDEEDGDDDDESDDDEDVEGAVKQLGAVLPGVKITLAKAVAIAAEEAKGAAFRSRFEVDDGIPTFEVFVLAGGDAPKLVDVDVDARNGKVLETETIGRGDADDDEDEHDEEHDHDDEDDEDE